MLPDSRPSWDDYFMGLAYATAERANCTRRKVGAVLVKNNRIISTGYNGAPSGHNGCLTGGCPRGSLTHEQLPKNAPYDDPNLNSFCTSNHAEVNAILYAGRDSHSATMYITQMPCPGCMKTLLAAGISEIRWHDSPDGEMRTLVLAGLTDFPYELYRKA